jgi:glutamyl endopeptidase
VRTQRYAPDLDPNSSVSSLSSGSTDFESFTTKAHSGETRAGGEYRAEISEGAPTPAAVYLPPDTNVLQDVARATYGPPPAGRESLIGSDDRTRIPNPQDYPWRINASLQILSPDNRLYVGTGWFVGPRTLITAGHCVFIHDELGRYSDWAPAIRVMAGRNGPSTPYGVITSSSFRTTVGWARDQDPEYDYAVIVLPTELGLRTGWLALGVRSDQELIGVQAHIAGYPGDKTGEFDGTLWVDTKAVVAADSRKIYYEIDTVGGQSGSAVCVGDRDSLVAIGVHAYGQNSFGNSATRISPTVLENIQSWLEEQA